MHFVIITTVITQHISLRLATNLLSPRLVPLRARQLSHMKPDGHKCSKYRTQIRCTARPHSLHSMNLYNIPTALLQSSALEYNIASSKLGWAVYASDDSIIWKVSIYRFRYRYIVSYRTVEKISNFSISQYFKILRYFS